MKIILYLEKNYTLFGNLSVATLWLTLHHFAKTSPKVELSTY